MGNVHMQEVNFEKMITPGFKDELYFNNNARSKKKLVWQQMTYENFCLFLEKQALYFKNLALYSDEEERKLRFYSDCYLENRREDIKPLVKRLYSDFEKIVYISCWFDLEWLTKLVFNAYAGDFGIAIGILKKKLIEVMKKNASSHEEIFYGNVAYIGDEKKKVIDSEEAIAPIFLKSKLFSPDNEFRLAYINDSLWERNLKGLRLPEEIPAGIPMGIGNVSDFIDYIAVRDCKMTFEAICEKYRLPIQKAEMPMDGFEVYEIKRQ